MIVTVPCHFNIELMYQAHISDALKYKVEEKIN